jgi:hypothetical protein
MHELCLVGIRPITKRPPGKSLSKFRLHKVSTGLSPIASKTLAIEIYRFVFIF